MQQLELTPTETIILYGFISATLETMVDKEITHLSNPNLTLRDMEGIKHKLQGILNNIQNNN
jgi:hypothetical protein